MSIRDIQSLARNVGNRSKPVQPIGFRFYINLLSPLTRIPRRQAGKARGIDALARVSSDLSPDGQSGAEFLYIALGPASRIAAGAPAAPARVALARP